MSSVTKVPPVVKAGRSVVWSLAAVAAAGMLSERTQQLRDSLHQAVVEILMIVGAFSGTAPTPEGMWEFERALEELLRRMGCLIVEQTLNQLEPEEPARMPSRVRRGSQEFSRKGSKTRQRGGVACLFGMIELWRWSYEPLSEERDAGARSIAPLGEQLGLVADKATPALAETIGRLSQERSESSVKEFLEREHAVTLCSASIGKIRDAVAQGVAVHLQEQRIRVLKEAIREGQKLGRVILAVGRDGIFVPLRGVANDRWKEAAVGTVSVYVQPRRGKLRRLCTVYLGQTPKPGQEELSDDLTDLLKQVLSDECARGLSLVYITDAGHHPREYYEQVLAHMDDPHRPGHKLSWQRIVDFFHVCGRLNQLAEGLFPDAESATAWVRRMRHILKHEPNAVHKILHSAAALRPKTLRGVARKRFREAWNYLVTHRAGMDYASYRRRRLPIGSGVTEAACKTVFTQRFKCSGMTWKSDDFDHRDPDAVFSGARSVLTLRLAHLSKIYPTAFQAYLSSRSAAAKPLTNPLLPTDTPAKAA